MNKRGRKQKDRPKAVSLCWRRGTAVSNQVHEHGRAGVLSLGERLKRRAADLYGAPVLIDRTPRCHEAETSTKAGTVAALKADYEQKTVAGRVCRSAELMMRLNCMCIRPRALLEGDSASLSRTMQRC